MELFAPHKGKTTVMIEPISNVYLIEWDILSLNLWTSQ